MNILAGMQKVLITDPRILLQNGFWEKAHAARTDFSMLTGSIFLLLEGAGKWSLDLFILKRMKSR